MQNDLDAWRGRSWAQAYSARTNCASVLPAPQCSELNRSTEGCAIRRAAGTAYADLLEIGDGGQGKFAKQLKHARNMVFHYQALLTGEGEEHERLKQAMRGHADDELELGIERGKVEDIPPALTGFRSHFADDIATEMLLPEDAEEEMSSFLGNVAEHSAKLMIFGKPAFNAYTHTLPLGTWHVERVGVN